MNANKLMKATTIIQPKPLADGIVVAQTARAFLEPGQVTEVRALDATTTGDRYPQTYSGYFDDADTLADAVATIRSARAIYFTPNPVNPALLSRAHNRIRPAKKDPTTADHDICRRHWLLIDADPVRPSGISSTDGEHDAALARATCIRDELVAAGWGLPIEGDSSNGAHLAYRIDEPVEDGGLIQRLLTTLNDRHGDDVVKIDLTVFNPARIWKLYGTRSCKGDDTPDRPHRMSRLLYVPDELTPVPHELLLELAGPPPHVNGKAKPARKANGAARTLDLADWIRTHGLTAEGPEDWTPKGGGTGKRWVFPTCPWNSDHTNRSAYVVQFPSGAIEAGCHHDSCAGKGWHDLRRQHEPDLDARRQKHNGRSKGGAKRKAVANQVEEALDPGAGDEAWEPDRLSQQANAEQLVAELDGNARWDVSRGGWNVYRPSEGRFVPDETGAVDRAAKHVARQAWDFVSDPPPGSDSKAAFKHAIDSEKASGIAAMMRLAQTEAGISVAAREFDRDGFLLNTLTATLDLRDGTARPHRREDLITKLAPVRHDPAARCPLWDRFLLRVMDGNTTMIDYLARVAGLCLTGDATVQELFIPWGGGANGKSVFFDTLTAMLGDYAGTAPDSLLTVRAQSEHPTEIADLCGKRCVVASETEQGAKLRVQLVKRLTGDMTIKGRFMRQDYFEFPRTHKLILVTNNKPQINETTNAVWRRVRLIPFTVTIPPDERDPQLLLKLQAEWPGILNWCLRGCLDWQANGMQTPDEVKVATAEYQQEQDQLSEFIAERCHVDPHAYVCRNEILAAYQAWAKAAGINPPLDRNSFYDSLRRVPGVGETMKRRDGAPTRVFTGIEVADLSSQYRRASERVGVTA